MKLTHLICSFACAKRIVALMVNTVVSYKRSVSLEQACPLEKSLSLSHLHLAPADISHPANPMETRPEGHRVCMEIIWVYSTLSSLPKAQKSKLICQKRFVIRFSPSACALNSVMVFLLAIQIAGRDQITLLVVTAWALGHQTHHLTSPNYSLPKLHNFDLMRQDSIGKDCARLRQQLYPTAMVFQ